MPPSLHTPGSPRWLAAGPDLAGPAGCQWPADSGPRAASPAPQVPVAGLGGDRPGRPPLRGPGGGRAGEEESSPPYRFSAGA